MSTQLLTRPEDRPVLVAEPPPFLPASGVGSSPQIFHMAERVKAQYVSWGILKPGDGFALSYDRVFVEASPLELGPIDRRVGEVISIDTITYRNDTEFVQEVKYSTTRETVASLGVSVTAGFQQATTLSSSVSVAKLIEGSQTHQFNFSLSATTNVSFEEKRSWTWDWPIKVPARSSIEASAVLRTIYVEPNFKVRLKIGVERHPNFDPGYHPLYVAVTRNGGTDWYRSSLQAALNPGSDGFTYGPDQNTVFFTCTGKFNGSYGRDLHLQLKQFPLSALNEAGAPPVTSISLLHDAATGHSLRSLSPPQPREEGEPIPKLA